MNHLSVRRRLSVPGTLTMLAAGALVLAGCQDKRVKELKTGITRDSAVSVIAHDVNPNAPADSFPNVYSRERYLINGQNYEVLYFTAHDEKQGKDSVKFKDLTPLVFVGNKLVGKGWGFWDSVSTANKIPLRKR